MATRDIGRAGEDSAVEFLEKRGWRIVDRNWLCREGELDIVGVDPAVADTLVFVEVKYRTSTRFGSGVEAVTPEKQRKVVMAALRWLEAHRSTVGFPGVRFDVIDIGPRGVRTHVEAVV